MRFGPLENLAELRPVINIFELHFFYRSAGDDHAVVVLVADIVQGNVERLEVLARHVRGLMADGLEKVNLDLKGRVGELAQDLRFGLNLGGHEV